MILYSILCIVIFFIVYNEISFIRSKRFHLGQKIGGPAYIPFFGSVLWILYKNLDPILIIDEYISKERVNSGRVWIGHRLMYFSSHVKNLEMLMGSTEYIDKGPVYYFMKPWLRKGLLTSTGNYWKQRRRLITPTFHFKILEKFIDAFNTNGEVFINKLRERVNKDSFDVHKLSSLYTLDVICEAAMGVKINAQIDSNSEYVQAVQAVASVIIKRVYTPWLMYDSVFNFTKSGKAHNAALTILHGTARKAIEERSALREKMKLRKDDDDDFGEKPKLAFLDMLLEASENGEKLSFDDIQEEVDTFMFEGHDTTASAVSFTLAMLAENQDVQDKVLKELQSIFGDSMRHSSYQDLQEMKYMEAVIKESLRLYPSVPAFSRILKQDFKTYDGLIIPKETEFVVPVFSVHRNPEWFPDPLKFDPGRFMNDSTDNRHPYMYIPFSAGPRNCIGQKFAMMEVKTILAKIVRNFVIKTNTKILEPELVDDLILKSETGVNIYILERK